MMTITATRPSLKIARHFTTEGVHPYDTVTWERRDARITDYRTGDVAFEQLDIEVPSHWSVNATNILAQKYFRGVLGSPERETSLRQVVDRVVNTITAWGIAGDSTCSRAYALSPRSALEPRPVRWTVKTKVAAMSEERFSPRPDGAVWTRAALEYRSFDGLEITRLVEVYDRTVCYRQLTGRLRRVFGANGLKYAEILRRAFELVPRLVDLGDEAILWTLLTGEASRQGLDITGLCRFARGGIAMGLSAQRHSDGSTDSGGSS